MPRPRNGCWARALPPHLMSPRRGRGSAATAGSRSTRTQTARSGSAGAPRPSSPAARTSNPRRDAAPVAEELDEEAGVGGKVGKIVGRQREDEILARLVTLLAIGVDDQEDHTSEIAAVGPEEYGAAGAEAAERGAEIRIEARLRQGTGF